MFNFLKRLFKRKRKCIPNQKEKNFNQEQYDTNPEDNQPREVYGVPNYMNYVDMKEKDEN